MRYLQILLALLFIASCSAKQSEEQQYISTIEPAIEDLEAWISGPVYTYDKALNTWITEGGKPVTANDPTAMPVNRYLEEFWQYPDISPYVYVGVPVYFVKFLAPAANLVSSDGFSVLSKFNSMTPPSSIKTAHDQIASCIQYKVEMAAEIEQSITTNYFLPNLQESDPCNLLEPALANLEQYIEENK